MRFSLCADVDGGRCRYSEAYTPDAYTRLLLDTLRGSQATFVRSDELEAAWRIFDPLLKLVDAAADQPAPYVYGSRGPDAADKVLIEQGLTRNSDYAWNENNKPSSTAP